MENATFLLWSTQGELNWPETRCLEFRSLAMESKCYESYRGQTRFSYRFYSCGSRGRILKQVDFTLFQMQPIVAYNVSFGDVDENTGEIDTGVVSNNADRDQVLLTVATIITRFCRRNPQVYVVARGNSPARNRLYRMMISKRLDEIQKRCEIYGILGSKTVAFQKNVNYTAFAVKTLGI